MSPHDRDTLNMTKKIGLDEHDLEFLTYVAGDSRPVVRMIWRHSERSIETALVFTFALGLAFFLLTSIGTLASRGVFDYGSIAQLAIVASILVVMIHRLIYRFAHNSAIRYLMAAVIMCGEILRGTEDLHPSHSTAYQCELARSIDKASRAIVRRVSSPLILARFRRLRYDSLWTWIRRKIWMPSSYWDRKVSLRAGLGVRSYLSLIPTESLGDIERIRWALARAALRLADGSPQQLLWDDIGCEQEVEFPPDFAAFAAFGRFLPATLATIGVLATVLGLLATATSLFG